MTPGNDRSASFSRAAEDRQHGQLPFLVVATAGTTAAGAIDPLPETAEIAAKHDLWLHVDAAWGGAAAFSAVLRRHLHGIERADSVTCDAHKWLSVPMGAGMFFCRHPEPVSRAFRIATQYMPGHEADTVDSYATSPQWSRRFIGLKVFMTLAEAGWPGVVRRIEHQTRLGELLRRRLREHGYPIVNDTPLPVVCFSHPEVDAEAWVAEVNRRGRCWVSTVDIPGGRVGRACVTSFDSTEADIETLVSELTEAGSALQKSC